MKKNVIIKSLPGIMIGGFALLISYISLNLIDEELYIREIRTFENVNILINQLYSLTIIYFILKLFINICKDILFDIEKIKQEGTKNVMKIVAVLIILVTLIYILIVNNNAFSENIRNVHLGIITVIFAISVLAVILNSIKIQLDVKKINKKIKDKTKD